MFLLKKCIPLQFKITRSNNNKNKTIMAGVENLKKVLASVISLFNKVDTVTQDGFQFVPDSIALAPNLVDVVVIIKDGKQAWLELKDRDAAEKEEVFAFLQEKFDLEDDDLEAIIEKAIKLIDDGIDLALAIKAALAKE